MKLGLPIVWDDRDRLHEPGEEVRIGVRTPGTEVPRRAEVIRDALRARDTPFVDARPRPDDAVLAVHDTALVDELRTPWDEAGLAAVEGLTASATANGGKTLVVAVGPDAASSRAEGPLDVTEASYRRAGRSLARPDCRPSSRRRAGTT